MMPPLVEPSAEVEAALKVPDLSPAQMAFIEGRPPTLAEQIRSLPDDERQAFEDALSEDERYALVYDWYGVHARESQKPPPGKWRTWVVLAGRGFGKTRVGAEWIRDRVARGLSRNIALVARTKAEIRDVMLNGPAGLITISPPDFMPVYEPSKRKLTWPNGAWALCFSADEPDQLRGPGYDTYWADELGAWRQPKGVGELSAWDHLMLGMREGSDSRGIVTTTPRRNSLLAKVLAREGVVITGGSTYENYSNLSTAFMEEVVATYEGTRVGKQELYAILDANNPDALWREATIEPYRVRNIPRHLKRIIVGVDPEAASTERSAETGIVVAGRGVDNHLYVLADLTVRGTPETWGRAAVAAYHAWKADLMVGEVNNGGDMVEHVIRTIDPGVAFKAVRASRGKVTRAEPISTLYEKGKAHHYGAFSELEDQMCQWVPGDRSPDRVDALVWAATELMLGAKYRGVAVAGPPRALAPGFRPIGFIE